MYILLFRINYTSYFNLGIIEKVQEFTKSMNHTSSTVPLVRSDKAKITPPIEITNDRGSVLVLNSKDTIENDETTKVKRSARLSKKRKCLHESVSEDDVQDDNKKRKIITKNQNLNETKSRKSMYSWSCPKKTNSGIFGRSTRIKTKNIDLPIVTKNVESSHSTNRNLEENVFLNSLSKNKKISKSIGYTKKMNMVLNSNIDELSNDVEVNDYFVYNRKRGRPPSKKIHLKKFHKLYNVSSNDQQKTKSLDAIVEQIHNTNGLTLSETLDSNTTTEEMIYNDELLETKKKLSIGKSSSVVAKTHSCSSIIQSDAVKVPNTSAETSSDANVHLSSELGMLERQLSILSNRFNVPFEILRKIVVEESLSVFREKYSESITPSMLTVSPIVLFNDKSNSNVVNKYEKHVEYKIEPIRWSEVYEKTNLKDLMEEISKSMPSWSLNIVNNPPRYVISNMSIDMFGTPFVNKAVVFDSYFRASVYINQCLEYKYCKRYKTATEIVNLIMELNNV